MPTTLLNPKTNEKIVTEMTAADAFKILSKLESDFAKDLYRKFHDGRQIPSDAQWFWIFKLATDAKSSEVHVLECDLHQWLLKSQLNRIMWRIDGEARIKLYIKDEKIDVVFSGGDMVRFVGYIKADKFYPKPSCPVTVKAQIILLARHQMKFLTAYGKRWGRCCVCGRELENEVSVAMGIGPICAGRFG